MRDENGKELTAEYELPSERERRKLDPYAEQRAYFQKWEEKERMERRKRVTSGLSIYERARIQGPLINIKARRVNWNASAALLGRTSSKCSETLLMFRSRFRIRRLLLLALESNFAWAYFVLLLPVRLAITIANSAGSTGFGTCIL